MNIKFTLKLIIEAFRSIQRRKLRSFLTAFGIIIGTTTIALIVGIGVGAQADIAKQYSNMSATTIFVNPAGDSSGSTTSTSIASKTSVDDIAKLLKSDSIASVTPQISGREIVSNGTTANQFTIVGALPSFSEMLDFKMVEGKFLPDNEVDTKSKNVVIGFNVAEDLFGANFTNITGKILKISKKDYTIIGVIEYRGGALGKVNIDDSIFMYIDTAQRNILGADSKMTLILQAKTVEQIESAMSDAQFILREEHGLRAGQVDDFKLKDMGSTVTAAVSSSQTMTILLISVAIIVLLVGGIGIMNVMYISVEERTKEIGIRKAIGANAKVIMQQFLFEAIILSIISALLGLLIAIGLQQILNQVGYAIVTVLWGYGLAFASSVLIGVFFGYYPAQKASSLKPIDALRHE